MHIVIDNKGEPVFHFLTQVYIGAAEAKPRIPVMSMVLEAVVYCLPESANAMVSDVVDLAGQLGGVVDKPLSIGGTVDGAAENGL